MNRRFLVGVVAALAAMVLPAGTVGAANIVNGSFEGTAGSGAFTTLAAGSMTIDGWTVSSGTVDWIGSYWASFDGSRSLDLNGYFPGGVSQAVATDPGTAYEVTFEMAGNPTCGSAVKTLNVSVDGGSTSAYSFDTTGMSTGSMGWTQESYSFIATGANSLLAFVSSTGGQCGPALDMVTLSAPAALTAADCKAGGWRTMTNSGGESFRNQGDCVSYYATRGRNLASGER